VLPATIFAGVAALALFPTFAVALWMRFSWDVAAMTVQGTAYQLSFHAIPASHRGRLRALLEGVVNPIGGVAGGTILILLNRSDLRSGTGNFLAVCALALFFSLLWLHVAWKAKGVYRRAVLKNLESLDPKTCRDAEEMLRGEGRLKARGLRLPLGQRIRQRKIFGGRGELSIAAGSDFLELQVKVGASSWHLRNLGGHWGVVEDGRVKADFAGRRSGSVHREWPDGYAAALWKRDGIRWVEWGDYGEGCVFGAVCRAGECDPFRKLTCRGEFISPARRFRNKIAPRNE
jgi:hypothetical protein